MTLRLPTTPDGVRVERSHTRGRRRTVVSIVTLELEDASEMHASVILDDRAETHRDRVHLRTRSATLTLDLSDVNAVIETLRRAKAMASRYRRTLRGAR